MRPAKSLCSVYLQVAVDEIFGKCAQIARRAEGLLHLGEAGHEAVALGLESVGARGGVHQRAGREHVAGGVAAQVAVQRLPAAELAHALVAALEAGEHAGVVAEAVEQARGGQRRHPGGVALEVVAHAAGQQRHVARVEGAGAHGRGVLNSYLPGVLAGVKRLGGSAEHSSAGEHQGGNLAYHNTL